MHYTLTQLFDLVAHAAPNMPPTVDRAHELMRVHRECTVDSCAHKCAAFEVLIAARHIVPDSSRRY
ncbi:hypothetical protein NDR87_27625 [Nocardia sp. CDC159]|uniref:Uncharacterized protein n=1 Tax=Nocardia pulmonis TaxID=2951408 RepID=A0A9X2IYP1_9NOCA|nr:MULTISPECIES: hypothetical protein [Nocardia]MCM6777262.1 hypothetical protein [Nocardia pulmonis]MCM6790147.1 hypothetical protein [Nocardia sp. CDC159]